MKEQVFNCMNVGYENKITYDEIQAKTGLSKRRIRQDIAELREDGHAIISSSHFNGFFVPDIENGVEDVMRMRAETLSRIEHLFKTVKTCDRYIEHFNQETLEI